MNALEEFLSGMRRGAGFLFVVLLGSGITIVVAQQIQSFDAGQVVSASAMNANFAAVRTDINANSAKIAGESPLKPPVGSIIAWHKDLGGVPALPAGWMECDGSTVNDPDSPLDGRVLPNLNGQRRFLRGNPTSGGLENDMFRSHTHSAPLGGFFHYVHGSGSTGGGGGGGIDGWTPNTMPTGGSETRPINMSVVWIIRVK